MGRYGKAIMAALIASLGTAQGLDFTDGFPASDWITTLVTGLLAGGAAWGIPNSGFVDLSRLTAEQRAQVGQFLNLR